MDLYHRQTFVFGLEVPDNVAVVGVGGIGSWISILSAMSGTKNLYLFDKDVLEEHNFNRIPLPVQFVGSKKVTAISSFIRLLRPACNIKVFDTKVDTAKQLIAILPFGSVVYLCIDSTKERRRFSKVLREHELRVVNCMAEVNHITLTDSVEDVFSVNEEVRGYANPMGQWVCPQALIASMAVSSVVLSLDKGLDISVDIQNMINKLSGNN